MSFSAGLRNINQLVIITEDREQEYLLQANSKANRLYHLSSHFSLMCTVYISHELYIHLTINSYGLKRKRSW